MTRSPTAVIQTGVEAAGLDTLPLRMHCSNDRANCIDASTVVKNGKAQILVNHLTLVELASAKHRVLVPVIGAPSRKWEWGPQRR